MTYPPRLSDEQYAALVSDIKDWQITHGSLLKLVHTDDENTVQCQPVGTTLFPTLFPRALFDEAHALQTAFNKLYAAVSEDDEWLLDVLGDLIEVDDLASALWEIYQEVKEEGIVQGLTLGIFRSDYMMHIDSKETSWRPELKQVELNTVSCAGGVHTNIVSNMHRHLHRTGAYRPAQPPSSDNLIIKSSFLPSNSTLKTISAGLAAAHKAYGPAKTQGVTETCILFIVAADNFNIADERPIEYALWDESIPSYRVSWGHDVLIHTSLSPTRELLYRPPSRLIAMEVSVVYFRTGFEVHEYNDIGRMVRLQLEKSRAIKSPSILSHFTGFKKVQQALTTPGALERWLAPREASKLSGTFAPMYPLDDSPSGQHAKKLALSPETASNYVLKPSLEGGGHNVYGDEIAVFLPQIPEELWKSYILMEKISPPLLNNFMMSSRGLYEGPVISELGIFGVCLWKRVQDEESARAEMVSELNPSWSLRTKDASVDEMSVVKGYGCFDSPALVDWDIFMSALKA
ncbi:putative glutathione synthetase [Stipitochalara longipes BDJ]|nr:putative glutathione synthetase [Stipitochalara longipes BDJ]